MPLESATHIADLNTSNPVGSTDKVQTLDDHVRLIKSVLKTDLNLVGAVTASHSELNILDGATLSTDELNILDGVTLTAAQINDAARKSAANTFTAAQTIEHTSPEFVFHETDAAANNGWWSFVVAAEQLRGVAYSDVFAGNNWLVVDRTGNTIDQVALSAGEIDLTATTLDLNGNLDVSGTVTIGGALTTPNTSATEVGKTGAPSRSISASGNTAASDQGGTVRMTGGSGQTFTLDGDIPSDCFVILVNSSGNDWTIAASGTLTFAGATGSRTLATGCMAVALAAGAGNYNIAGQLT